MIGIVHVNEHIFSDSYAISRRIKVIFSESMTRDGECTGKLGAPLPRNAQKERWGHDFHVLHPLSLQVAEPDLLEEGFRR